MQQDSSDDIQNSNLVSDDLTSHLASTGVMQQPGQQFTPDPTASPAPVATSIGSHLPDPTPAPMSFTPPIPAEPTVPAADEAQVDEALNNLSAPAPTEPAEETPAPQKSYEVTPEEIAPMASNYESSAETTEEPKEKDELDEIKIKALGELKPLVSKLDLTPEKRYDLLMEIIQASNDKSLLEEAYEAAHKIEDDDLRAQALMEVVNEIEYLKTDKAA